MRVCRGDGRRSQAVLGPDLGINLPVPTQGRQNISPDKIPWSALKTLMAQSIYGGRVDNEFDQRLLNTFLERLFTTKSFDSEFKLACKVDGHKDIQMPDGIRYAPAYCDRHGRDRHLPTLHVTASPNVLFSRREEFVQWVELLPDTQTPSWLGLPNNAERVLLTTQGECPAPGPPYTTNLSSRDWLLLTLLLRMAQKVTHLLQWVCLLKYRLSSGQKA